MDDASNQPISIRLLWRVLSHPKRMEILEYLARKWGKDTDEVELAGALRLMTPKVRYHLTVLRDAHLITHAGDRERERETAGRYAAVASIGPVTLDM